mmetsp:Transcript_52020/g.96312  ORF Transcript_52020/g.96312 Transcript_52020/m.96312 type:complete len:262 (+) Transcript_52020:194-979(+)
MLSAAHCHFPALAPKVSIQQRNQELDLPLLMAGALAGDLTLVLLGHTSQRVRPLLASKAWPLVVRHHLVYCGHYGLFAMLVACCFWELLPAPSAGPQVRHLLLERALGCQRMGWWSPQTNRLDRQSSTLAVQLEAVQPELMARRKGVQKAVYVVCMLHTPQMVLASVEELCLVQWMVVQTWAWDKSMVPWMVSLTVTSVMGVRWNLLPKWMLCPSHLQTRPVMAKVQKPMKRPPALCWHCLATVPKPLKHCQHLELQKQLD